MKVIQMKQEILESLNENPIVQGILHDSNDIGNLFMMEEALALASAFEQEKKSMVIVKKNRFEAMQLYNRLKQLQQKVLLFAVEESLRVVAIASSPEEKEEQIDTLIQLSQNKEPVILICNTAGFLRYLPRAELFANTMFDIHTDDDLNMSELKEKLNRAGYTRVNYVDRPCTYASRGGIVDIFTLEYDHPVRIEFFDTQVESIRFFDEQTQRTIQTLDQVRVAPATDLLFDEDQMEQLKQKVKEKYDASRRSLSLEEAEMLQDHIEADLRAIANYDPDPHLYWYFSYLNTPNIMDYINGKVIFSNIDDVRNAQTQINKDAITFMQEMVQDNKALGQYMMYHDLDALRKNLHYQDFHPFLSYENPIYSQIEPLESQADRLYAFLDGLKEDIYVSVSEEDRKKIEEKGPTHHVHFIEPFFYEGFKTEKYEVYTGKELLKQSVRTLKYQKTFKEGQMLQNVLELAPNDYVVHGTYGIGQYKGIVSRKQNGKMLDYLHIIYRGGDDLFVPLSQFQLVRKYISKEGAGVKLSALGSKEWQKTKEKVSAKVEQIAARLVELYASRNEHIGYAYPKDDALQVEFDEAFEYEPTQDQLIATQAIKEEMEKDKPMDHLLCGDVGFGKTEVAMRCIFKAISAGKQVAVLCPTTVLSMQHYQTFSKRFEYTGASIALINRFTSLKDFKAIKEGLKNGTIDIVIGTHRLFNKSIEYKDLGFLVIDEEQRFGVEHKEKIKELKNSIDVLTLSATPIPRTLQMSLIGVRTISQLNTPPASRHPVQTYVLEKKPTVIEEVISRELARNGQVFYLYNHIDNIYAVAKNLQEKFKDHKVAVAHGQQSREQIEKTMKDFSEAKYDILVCTTIIETGLDIANANTIIIEDADHFGLAQLYQIRGRVGRREKLAYCYLMIQPYKQLSEQASKRLKSIKEFTQLGSGYKIAMRDLTIRGAGDMLGPQQAGFIDQVGMDMYLEMLAQAIARHQGKEIEQPKEMKSAQVQLSGHIPVSFTENDGDKLSLYQQIKAADTYGKLEELEERTKDLFGKIPKEVEQLFFGRRMDLFVNLEGVDNLKEESTQYIIVMDENFSKNVNGMELFRKVSDLSRSISLKLEKGHIVLRLEKKKNTEALLEKVMVLLKDMIAQLGEQK
jgi:transcription-repair coupling factor (superfamily II helicase)